MTTNEAVAYIDDHIRKCNDFILQFRDTDEQIKGHLDKLNESLTIIKQDLTNGFQHYTGGPHESI